MKKRERFTLVVVGMLTLCLFVVPIIANSATLYVATNGSNIAPYDTWAKAATSIQTVIDSASAGDIIIVGSSGTGHGTGEYTENVNVTKSLTIKSESGYAKTTVVAADTTDHVFKIQASNVTIGSENCGFSIYGATGSMAGIYFRSSITGCSIQDNRCGWDPEHKSYFGISLYSSSNNTLTGNTASFNTNCGIYLYRSYNNTLTGNTASSNNRGIYLYDSGNNTLTGNTASSNNNYGIWLYYSSNNTLTDNTAISNNYGIYLNSSSNNNTIYLNNLSGNTSGNAYVEESSSDNIWNSPTPIYYDYTSVSFHKNYLGNYYGDYNKTDQDSDGDGIGTDPYNGTGMTDNYPLMATSDHYSLQAWWLNSDSKMYKDDRSKAPGSVTIANGGSHIWTADQAALMDIEFSGGDTWTGQIVFTSAPESDHTFTIEIGSSTNGSDFTAGDPDATITGDGSSTIFIYETDAGGFTVTAGSYLAIKVTNHSSSSYNVQTGGPWSYCSEPSNSPDYLLTTVYVATNGSNTPPYNTWVKAARSIQNAITFATVGDTIIVGSSGTEHGDGIYTENVDVTKSLTIKSENGYATTTVSAANANDHVFDVQASSVTIGGENCGFSIYGATGKNRVGIYLKSGITGCTIQDNRCGWDNTHYNYWGIELDYFCNANTLTGNTASSNTDYGIFLCSSGNNTLTGNTASSNNYGIWLYISSNNTLTGNTISSNATYGIMLFNSINNTIYLNNLCNNPSGNAYDYTSGNNWNSPTPIYYDYTSGSFHKNYLGNYYSDYDTTGQDSDGDGIGTAAYSKNSMTDKYPLMDTSACYSLQAWWLNSDSKMYRDDMSKAPGSVTITSGGSHIWIADQATLMDISFSGSDTWTGQVVFTSAPTSGDNFTVEIGSWNGSDFTAGGPDATINGNGSATVFTYTTDASAFTVTTGKYLALRITNNSSSIYAVQTGGAWSYCSSPLNSTDYSLPVELTSFTATPGNGIITLNWLTESEIENLGFNIYRSTEENGEFLMLNDKLIAGAGSSSEKHEYSYVDHDVKSGITYWYKLEDVDYKGKTELHGAISAAVLGPKEFCLHPNYPNPFNPVTTISYDLPKDVYVELAVYNLLGEKVTTLVKGNQPAGYYNVEWDGRNSQGRIVSSGMYFLRISAGSYCKTNKMVFVR